MNHCTLQRYHWLQMVTWVQSQQAYIPSLTANTLQQNVQSWMVKSILTSSALLIGDTSDHFGIISIEKLALWWNLLLWTIMQTPCKYLWALQCIVWRQLGSVITWVHCENLGLMIIVCVHCVRKNKLKLGEPRRRSCWVHCVSVFGLWYYYENYDVCDNVALRSAKMCWCLYEIISW